MRITHQLPLSIIYDITINLNPYISLYDSLLGGGGGNPAWNLTYIYSFENDTTETSQYKLLTFQVQTLMSIFHHLVHLLKKKSVQVRGSWTVYIKFLSFYGEKLLAPGPTAKLENNSMLFVCGCLFNMFTAECCLSAGNTRMPHAVVTIDPPGMAILVSLNINNNKCATLMFTQYLIMDLSPKKKK
jgi:hypothetical protein